MSIKKNHVRGICRVYFFKRKSELLHGHTGRLYFANKHQYMRVHSIAGFTLRNSQGK